MRKSTRVLRNEVLLSPQILRHFESERAAWHETKQEIEEGIAWGIEKARLLRWVRRQMRRRLTLRERRCVELYFFEHMTFRQVGAVTNTNASSACRAVQRSLRKLKQAAKESPPREPRQKPA